jgi:hypothetical protein
MCIALEIGKQVAPSFDAAADFAVEQSKKLERDPEQRKDYAIIEDFPDNHGRIYS